MAKNNARLRRRIAYILFEHGPLTRIQVCEQLHEEGLFREVPSESSLAALISKNTQVVSVGNEKIELSNGTFVRNMKFDVDRNLIKSEEDILLTMPYSSMTNRQKKDAVRCSSCKQLRLMPDMQKCLICDRRGV